MNRPLAALTTLAVLSSGCGMAVGLRPLGPDVQVQASEATVPGETEVAGITLTVPSSEPSTTTTPPETMPSNGTVSIVEQESTTTAPDPATTPPTDPVTTTTPMPTTTSPEATTTTGATVASVPELPDIGAVFADDEAAIVHDCAGGDVTILGDAGYFTLEGTCNTVLVKGSYNTIFIGVVSTIDLTGTLNAVLHGGGDIEINDWDGENIVTGG